MIYRNCLSKDFMYFLSEFFILLNLIFSEKLFILYFATKKEENRQRKPNQFLKGMIHYFSFFLLFMID